MISPFTIEHSEEPTTMYTLKELSKLIGVSANTIYRYVLDHNIPHKKNAHRRVVVALNDIAGYRPRSNPLWLVKASMLRRVDYEI